MTGTVVRVKGLKRYFEPKTGLWYCYHRKSGRRIKAEFGTSEFFAEFGAIDAEMSGQTAKPGTLGALIVSYRSSAGFQNLKTRTKADYQQVLQFLEPLAASPLTELTQGWVARLRDKTFAKRKTRFTNYVLAVLSVMFSHGVELELMAINPVAKVKKVAKRKDAPEANRPWTNAERDAVLAALPAHMLPPVALMMFAGLDPQDALLMPRTAYSEGRIDIARGKTGVPVWIPLIDVAVEIMANAPKHIAMTLCANSFGKPWTVSGFRASWRPIRTKLEEEGKVQPGLTLKGLRHTVATILRESGHDYATIALVLGQKTEAMAKHYSRRADMSKQMTETMKSFETEVNNRKTNGV